MTGRTEGVARSVHTRLVRHAKERGLDPTQVFSRYATERLLYRLSRSEHAPRFVLKGAVLLLACYGEATRPTRDADLLGSGDVSAEALSRTFTEVCLVPVEEDGMVFEADSVAVRPIRGGDEYGGQRVTVLGRLGAGKVRVQVDVGVGDAVHPAAAILEIPTILDSAPPRLKAYPPESVVAEKLQAMVHLGLANTRLKDFFDLHLLAMSRAFQGAVLTEAVTGTFNRRGTALPGSLPVALTPDFVTEAKQAQWLAFLGRGALAAPGRLEDVVELLAAFLGPVLAGSVEKSVWSPGGPWGTTGQEAGSPSPSRS